ncbi:MMPL family transporter [Intrasporangium calvum]|uniref:MmpL domain-containing protein n=1 Tax=Intrasporangium calvum (strain ATCC 23552 / DSM 43043 / JCM 3097 / NBRC 12989 / NCIMB 10167 / NRRL B-3866 / 7 KIP) TaxID=710696 RepID=E6SDY1_INTC7|nr:MMPL family transporter [Intrasporangium calvum]ADU47594.1 MmpL domain-containing protein [Intrasporangium calvum DSM 43043]
MSTLADRIARRITARWWAGAIALGVLLLSGFVTGIAGDPARQAKPTDPLPVGSDSSAAAALRERLPAAEGSTAVVLFSRTGEPLTEQDRAIVQERAAAVSNGADLPVVPSSDGTSAIVVVPVDANNGPDSARLITELRGTVKADLPDGLTAQVTGPAAVQADLAGVFEGANTRLLLTTASIVAALLVLTYRSPILWLIPLTVIGVADRVAMVTATHALSALDVAGDESTTGILSVLVFGAGTDYALLLISRYRDELRRHPDRREAMAVAVARTAEAVVSSASTVVLGVLTLLLSAFPTTRGLGLASAIGIVIAAAFALIVLPAALVVFGRWVFWPRVPHVGEPALADTRTLWKRIGDVVAARPRTVVAVTLAGLLIASVGALGINTGLSVSDQFLQKPEAIAASERLAESFPASSADPARVVTTDDAQAVLAAVDGAPGVTSARVSNQADGVTQIDAVLAGAPSSDQARQGVVSLRDAVAGFDGTHVGGTEAQALDTTTAAAEDRGLVLPVILALVLLVLMLLLRSVVAPVILVATVVATYVASLGISWVLFTQVFGFERLDDTAPLYAFVFLVALGVDYNIFLVSRAKEEAREHGARRGMLRGLAATGGVITSAGILLAAVFAVLGVLPLVVLAQVGVIICVGVLLDTLVVRTLLVPAIALMLGDRFWWPRHVSGGRDEVEAAPQLV